MNARALVAAIAQRVGFPSPAELRWLERAAKSSAAPVTPAPVAAAERPGAARDQRTPAPGHPALLRASAIQLEDWAAHVACPASIYCGSLARQLRAAADSFSQQ